MSCCQLLREAVDVFASLHPLPVGPLEGAVDVDLVEMEAQPRRKNSLEQFSYAAEEADWPVASGQLVVLPRLGDHDACC